MAESLDHRYQRRGSDSMGPCFSVITTHNPNMVLLNRTLNAI
jgi:hypothetical protein